MEQLLSTAEAAKYLGIKVETVKYHLYQARDLVADARVGKTLVFTKDTLDCYKKIKRGPGRPPDPSKPVD